jgi:hypothetical protein
MGTKPLADRVVAGRADQDRVRSGFGRQPGVAGLVDEAIFLVRTDRVLRVAMISFCGLVLFLVGLVAGRLAFSSTTVESAPRDDTVVITRAQADEFQQMGMELEQAESELAVSQGTAAFHETQAATLADEVSRLHSRLSQALLERDLIVSVYEECAERLYPRECIKNAQPELDGFLAELYSDQG